MLFFQEKKFNVPSECVSSTVVFEIAAPHHAQRFVVVVVVVTNYLKSKPTKRNYSTRVRGVVHFSTKKGCSDPGTETKTQLTNSLDTHIFSCWTCRIGAGTVVV